MHLNSMEEILVLLFKLLMIHLIIILILKLFGKKIGQDFFEGKITLPIILLFQKLELDEKKLLIEIFQKEIRDKNDLNKDNFFNKKI